MMDVHLWMKIPRCSTPTYNYRSESLFVKPRLERGFLMDFLGANFVFHKFRPPEKSALTLSQALDLDEI